MKAEKVKQYLARRATLKNLICVRKVRRKHYIERLNPIENQMDYVAGKQAAGERADQREHEAEQEDGRQDAKVWPVLIGMHYGKYTHHNHHRARHAKGAAQC